MAVNISDDVDVGGDRSLNNHVVLEVLVAKHRLVWYANRNTPKVVAVGKTATKKPSEGKVVKSRAATAAEEKQIAKGTWVRVDRNGKKPGQKGYGTGSKVRPQFNKPKSGK